MRARGSWLLGILACVSSAGCTHPASHAASPSAAAPRSAITALPSQRSARLFALPELSPQEPAFSAEPDGTRQLVLRGMRLLDHPSGALERADELLPAGRAVKALRLP